MGYNLHKDMQAHNIVNLQLKYIRNVQQMCIKWECHHNVVCIVQGWIVPGAMHHRPPVTSRGGAVAPADYPETK